METSRETFERETDYQQVALLASHMNRLSTSHPTGLTYEHIINESPSHITKYALRTLPEPGIVTMKG